MEENLSTSEKRHIIENIKNDANWLLNMVENILSVTRIDNDTAKVKKYIESVEEVVSSAVVRFKKRFPEAKLKVMLPNEVIMLMMDSTLIEQLIINLIQNAHIHSKSTKPIELNVQEYETKVWFSIRDYGVGIAEEKLTTIFDGGAYNQNNDTKADGHKGMGIGLSICKTIVKAHGGDIMVRNHEEGSEFYFYLPKEMEEQ
jgi:two-component system sensor histidine kinase KdpD